MRRMTIAVVLSSAVMFGIGLRSAGAQHEHGEEHEGHAEGAHQHGEVSGHSHDRAAIHGGNVTMSKEFHVETVFMPDQIRLYLYDGSQNPMHVKHWQRGLVEGTGVIEFRGRNRAPARLSFVRETPEGYACPMHADQTDNAPGECATCGMKLTKQKISAAALWACPMHPDENGHGPGTCADCGMKYSPQDYLVATADLAGLQAGDARLTVDLRNLPGDSERTLQFTEKYVPAKTHGEHHEAEHGEHEHGADEHGHGDHDH